MYKRWVMFIIIVVALAGCIDTKAPAPVSNNSTIPTSPPTPSPDMIFPVTEPTTVDVVIFASAFDPPVLRVVNGTTVRWTNKDSAIYIIQGAGFRSPELNRFDKWNYTFNQTGIFEYNISDHPRILPGRIIVNMSRPGNSS